MTAMLAWRPAGMAVHLVGVAVLARLLDPHAFGVFAVASAAYWLAEAAVDFGVASNLLRGRDAVMSEPAMAAAFGLWITTSLVFTALFLLGAFAVDILGSDAALALTLAVLAAALLLSSPVLVAETRLRHMLDPVLLARLPVVTALMSVAASALAAWAGMGAVALAVGLVAEKAGRMGLLLVQCRGRLCRPTLQGWRAHLVFGSAYTATSLLPKLSVAGRMAVISGTLGSGALGLMNRADAVARLNERILLESVAPLVLPVMAHASREGTSIATVYFRKVDYLAAVCWPAALAVIVLAEPLVSVLLGPGWSETVPLVRILALSALAFPVTRMSLNLFALLGAEREALRIQVFQQVFGFAVVAAAALVSLPAVCAATVLAHLVKAWRIMAAFKRLIGYPPGALRPLALRNTALSLATVAGPMTVMGWTDWSALTLLAAATALAFAGWLAAMIALGHPLLGQMRKALGLIQGYSRR